MESSNVYLISPGGSGTNWLYHLYTREYLSGGKKWFNPHQRFTSLPEGAKILYIMAHPLNILISYRNRGFFEQPHHVANMQGDRNAYMNSILGHGKSFDGYIRGGVNCFQFADHALKWHAYAKWKGNEYLFVKYEDLPKKWSEVENFIGKKTDLRWARRNSNYKSEKLPGRVAKMHQADINFYESAYKILI